LEYSKKLSTEIEEKVKIAKITEAKINETSENYRPAATRGALIFFLLSDLSKVHSFYKYSLESFIAVMNRAIDNISENKMFGLDTMIPFSEEDGKEGAVPEEHDPAAEAAAEAEPEAKVEPKEE
jgi:dynein heavy chain, axonemal